MRIAWFVYESKLRTQGLYATHRRAYLLSLAAARSCATVGVQAAGREGCARSSCKSSARRGRVGRVGDGHEHDD